MDPEKIEKLIKSREDSKRREFLFKVIELIESGSFDSEKLPREEIFADPTDEPRQTYLSPSQRDDYNYGYMEIGEMMASSPNVR